MSTLGQSQKKIFSVLANYNIMQTDILFNFVQFLFKLLGSTNLKKRFPLHKNIQN